jgi:capsular exopolysaccharide synthesis family protein
VTSAVPHEGKSTVALNLAQALALGGVRVLLVDGDLRRGRLHHALKVPAEPGFTEVIHGTGDLHSVSVLTDSPNLAFLPRGGTSDHPSELFLTLGFDRFLEEAKRTFDYVIVDTVPVFAADDAAALGAKMDGVLLVVRRGATSAGLVREALDLLYQRQSRILGLVFNRANSAARSYHYYKYADYAFGKAV